MNKKFSTLMASVLLAGSVFSAYADITNTAVKGDFVQLSFTDGTIAIGQTGSLEIGTAVSSVTDVTSLNTANAQLWQVASISYSPTTGTPFYQFINKTTGEYLAVELKTNNKGASSAAAKLNGTGNKDWAIAGDGTIYVFKGDSIYGFDSQMKLMAAEANSVSALTNPTKLTKLEQTTLSATLTPAIFNAIMAMPGHDGKLHFNGKKDVSEGEDNILTENQWVAYGASGDLFLAVKGKETPINKNPYLLMVDTTFYGPNHTYNKLVVDTLGWGTADNCVAFKNGTLAASSYVPTNTMDIRAIGTAMFSRSYALGNDSIYLRVKGVPQIVDDNNEYFFVKGSKAVDTLNVTDGAPITLTKLSNTKVLTVGYYGNLAASNTTEETVAAGTGDRAYIFPLIQPYAAAAAGDATLATDRLYFVQIKNAENTDKYLSYELKNSDATIALVASVSAYNSADQWAVVAGATGSYQLVNCEANSVKYAGPVLKLKDEDGNVVADTYVFGKDTLKLAAVDYSIATVEGDEDYTSYFYAGKDNDKVLRTFKITSASPFLSQLYMQAKSDSVAVLGEDAVVWTLETVKDSKATYGASLVGFKDLYRTQYNIAMTDADGNKYYLYNKDNTATITLSTSGKKTAYYLKTIDKGQYVIYAAGADQKLTINPTPSKPIIEVSKLDSERSDLFLIEQTNLGTYRELGVSIEDGLAEKAVNVAKIYMDNEPNRYLYENTQNIVANNGNKVAKDSLNFLGIYNTVALVKNAALYIDTAYVDRKDNLMPQYLLALGVEEVEANGVIPCTEKDNHFDAEGNKTDAEHCVHATPATKAYKTGRYLASVKDSVPAGSKTYPGVYDGSIRLTFVEATHIGDSLIIKDSKYTGTKNAKNDTLKIADQALNVATFAMLIKDQETKSFYLESAGKTYVRILNGVPVLTDNIENAAIFNIEATDEEATSNEAIEAAGVQVIAGKGVVTVQGAAGKVITVANILGQTIANQVAASDNVTIAAPAGVVVVAVEGEATKVVVK